MTSLLQVDQIVHTTRGNEVFQGIKGEVWGFGWGSRHEFELAMKVQSEEVRRKGAVGEVIPNGKDAWVVFKDMNGGFLGWSDREGKIRH